MRRLTNGVRYRFEVRAVNAAGGGPSRGLRARAGRAGAPDNFRARAGDASVTLRWDDPDDAAVTRYQLRLLDPEEGLLPWVVQPAKVVTTTRLVLRPMTNGLKYTAWVRALNHAGNGESASLTVVSGAPLAPVELRWMTIDGSFTLLWDDPENATITGYEFHYYRGDRPSQPVWTAIEMSGASTMRHGVAGVTEVGGYTFEVRAINAVAAGGSCGVARRRGDAGATARRPA